MNCKSLIVIIVVSLVNSGCAASYIGLTYHTDRPVMLGQMREIGGGIMQIGSKEKDFDISHFNGGLFTYVLFLPVGKGFVQNVKIQDRRDADQNLKIKIEAREEQIKVESVYFRSSFVGFNAFLFMLGIHRNTIGIRGGVYGRHFNHIKEIDL